MIVVNNIKHRYGDLSVLDDISFKLKKGSITCLLGPSGCGKTTLLNLLSGGLPLQSGSIEGSPESGSAYLFQEPRLLPWKTLGKNIDLILKNLYDDAERTRIISEMLSIVELEEFIDYYPHELSGGMRQRGALARAFAFPSDLILMDEPFQALDPALKLNLIADFQKLWARDKRTALLVTHNIQEATLLGDHIMVLSNRPARLIQSIDNLVKRDERTPYGEGVMELERKLYLTLTLDRIK